MGGSKLVFLKWRGDIVAVQTFGGTATPEPVPPDLAAEGVTLEVHDVAPGAELVAGRNRPDGRAALGVIASLLAHGVVAAFLAGAALLPSSAQIAADEANERAALRQDYLTRIAANEGDRPRDSRDERPGAHSAAEDTFVSTPAPQASASQTPEPSSHAPASAPSSRRKPAAPAQAGTGAAPGGQNGRDAVSTSPATCAPPPPATASGPMCTRSVVVVKLEAPPGCFTDTVVKSGQHGTLTAPCEGDGPATLAFGSRSFHGAAKSGRVDVCTGTEFPWSDGCAWTSAQHVSGSVADGTLRFSYGEAPKPGQQSCAPACGATGTVRIEPGA